MKAWRKENGSNTITEVMFSVIVRLIYWQLFCKQWTMHQLRLCILGLSSCQASYHSPQITQNLKTIESSSCLSTCTLHITQTKLQKPTSLFLQELVWCVQYCDWYVLKIISIPSALKFRCSVQTVLWFHVSQYSHSVLTALFHVHCATFGEQGVVQYAENGMLCSACTYPNPLGAGIVTWLG